MHHGQYEALSEEPPLDLPDTSGQSIFCLFFLAWEEMAKKDLEKNHSHFAHMAQKQLPDPLSCLNDSPEAELTIA